MTRRRTDTTRRHFLRSCLGAAAGGAGLWATQARLQLALAQTPAADDYKALVCVFLFGGNDSYNMIVPYSTSDYELYRSVRGDLAVPARDLLPLSTQDPVQYALHPNMAGAHPLFEQGRMAVMANTGALIEPVTKSDYQNNRVRLPPQLFSHNDQQNFVQSLLGSAESGWAGRAADIMQSMNTNERLSMNISLSGNNIWQSGDSVVPYSVSGAGVDTFNHFDGEDNTERAEVFRTLMNNADSHLFEREYAEIQQRAWNLSGELISALEGKTLDTAFPGSQLGTDMRMVARLISAREALDVKRQIFFVGLGGFDTHGDQNSRQPALFEQLSGALGAFDAAMTELGMADQVTAFTMSDFGRTLTSNGDGTDHAWGGHQLVTGGAVRGGQIVGSMPDLNLGSDDDIGEGRLIPTTSIDQYAATLAGWFGLSAQDYPSVFPNLANFNSHDLGFMRG